MCGRLWLVQDLVWDLVRPVIILRVQCQAKQGPHFGIKMHHFWIGCTPEIVHPPSGRRCSFESSISCWCMISQSPFRRSRGRTPLLRVPQSPQRGRAETGRRAHPCGARGSSRPAIGREKCGTGGTWFGCLGSGFGVLGLGSGDRSGFGVWDSKCKACRLGG